MNKANYLSRSAALLSIFWTTGCGLTVKANVGSFEVGGSICQSIAGIDGCPPAPVPATKMVIVPVPIPQRQSEQGSRLGVPSLPDKKSTECTRIGNMWCL